MTKERAFITPLAGENRALIRRIRSGDRHRKQAAEARRMAKLCSDILGKLER